MSFNDINFNTYIYKVLKQVHPSISLTKPAIDELSNICLYILDLIMQNINLLMRRNTAITLTTRDVESAVRLTLPGDLAKHAISEGTKSVSIFKESLSHKNKNAIRSSRSSRAGLLFSVSRVENIMRDLSIRDRLSFNSAVYLAAVIEYIIAEILQLSGNQAQNKGRARLTTRFIYLGISNDSELSLLFKNVYLAGGVLPSA